METSLQDEASLHVATGSEVLEYTIVFQNVNCGTFESNTLDKR